MYIALLISGEPRSIVFKEQIRFFTSLIRSLEDQGCTVHVYCMFKLNKVRDFINSEEGLLNFKEVLKILNPRHLELFFNFKEDIIFEKRFTNGFVKGFYSQIKMIDTLISVAVESNIPYDYFLRIRPDCILNGKLDIYSLNDSTVYTSLKCDSIGNDQMFICHRNMIDTWWINIIRPSLLYIYDIHPDSLLSPEYFIFNHCPTVQIIQSGLIRDYNKIIAWNTVPEDLFILDDFWNSYDSYLLFNTVIDFTEFKTKLQEISLSYNGNFNLSIPV